MIDPTGGAGTTGQNDPSTVWDGGAARTVVCNRIPLVAFTGSTNLVAAAPGLKTKVIGLYLVINPGPGTAGQCYLVDGTSTGIILMIGQIPITVPTTFTVALSGYMICQTGVNSILKFQNDAATATFNLQLQYYQAP